MSSIDTSQALTKDVINNYAREVFGEPKKVHSWMTTPNTFLKGMRPKDFIEYATQDDLQLVMDELGRIDQGLF
jgi:uncharacterized protein (DUF2384 family)